jgi:peroxiredoxin
MAALEAGAQAPNISLSTVDGQPFSLADARRNGTVVLAFFKVNCPTCQYAFPFIERLHWVHQAESVSIVGISQNEKRDTVAFIKEHGLTFPVLLDEIKRYPASNAYGLTNVPTIFLISPEGRVEFSSVSWVKDELEELHRRLLKSSGKAEAPLFRMGESIAAFKAG